MKKRNCIMDTIFVHSPLRSVCTPSSAIPDIAGFLESKGYSVYIYDANIDFYNWILNEEKIKDTYSLCYNVVNNLLDYKHPKEIQIKKFFDESEYSRILGKIEKAKNILRTKDFYNPVRYKIAHYVINKALELLSLPYDTWILYERSVIGNETGFEFNDYKNMIKEKEGNIFIEYMNSLAQKIIKRNANSVCILADIEGQIIPAMTLASILKENGQKNIVIFGNYIPLIQTDLKQDKTVFSDISDIFMYENNPIAMMQLMDYFKGKKKIETVNNILYLDDNKKIKENRYSDEKTKDFYFQKFEYINEYHYFFPEKVLPIVIADGCYWGKCKFCDLFSSKYSVKDINNVIKEIKFYKKKYGVKFFYLRDLSIAPSIAREFAKQLIKEKLNIRYSTFCRFDKEFDYHLLKLLYKSGLRCLNWGLESGSQKILDKMNKGINLSIVSRILKDAYRLGIANKVSFMYHFPGESYEDFCESVNFVKENEKYIFYLGVHEFYLKRYSYIFDHLSEFDIRLNTDKVRWEYSPNEFSHKYERWDCQKIEDEIKRINIITMGGYDEINLYVSKNPLYMKHWYVKFLEYFKTLEIRKFFR